MSVRTLADGRLEIKPGGNLVAKLFGLPFLAAGAWFLWQILTGIGDYVRADAIAQLPGQFFGFLFILVFAALFGVPGLLLTFGSKRVVIDAPRRELIEIFNWVVYRRATTHPLAKFKSIEVRQDPRSRSNLYHVELVADARDDVLVGIFNKPDPAIELARTLSGALSLPLRDRTDEPVESDE